MDAGSGQHSWSSSGRSGVVSIPSGFSSNGCDGYSSWETEQTSELGLGSSVNNSFGRTSGSWDELSTDRPGTPRPVCGIDGSLAENHSPGLSGSVNYNTWIDRWTELCSKNKIFSSGHYSSKRLRENGAKSPEEVEVDDEEEVQETESGSIGYSTDETLYSDSEDSVDDDEAESFHIIEE